MLVGIVIKAYSSYYYLQTKDKVTESTLRGRFKKGRFSLMVGDKVEYTLLGDGKGVIENILPRRSMLKRPLVANIDLVVLTFAAVNPEIDTNMIDRFLVMAESSGLDITIVINKTDLADTDKLDRISDIYRNIGYSLVLASAKTGEGVDELRTRLFDRITVFAGPSGVGKSSLLNMLQPDLTLVTGDVSRKIGRGRHTTRYAELMPLSGGGFVVDTPGYSLMEFADIGESELTFYYPDIAAVAPNCKFNTCLHRKEPQCAVKQAVDTGQIARERYHSYLEILNEIQDNRKGF